MPSTFDAHWLFRYDAYAFDAIAQRLDVAGLPRWSSPELADVLDANHAAVPAGAGLIPDQLVQIADAQRRDGAAWTCLDLYGPPDERDDVCLQYGLRRASTAPVAVIAYFREQTPAPLPNVDYLDRTAPPAAIIAPAAWADAVSASHEASPAPHERALVVATAALPNARFYALRIGDATAATLARFDWPGASQLAEQYTHPDFRKTGFAMALVQRATHDAPNRLVFAVTDNTNAAILRVARRQGGEVVLVDPRRRYVSPAA